MFREEENNAYRRQSMKEGEIIKKIKAKKEDHGGL